MTLPTLMYCLERHVCSPRLKSANGELLALLSQAGVYEVTKSPIIESPDAFVPPQRRFGGDLLVATGRWSVSPALQRCNYEVLCFEEYARQFYSAC